MSEIDPKLSRLYREASSEQPAAALDAAILAAAREQVAKPRRRELSSWWRWMAPASAIATLALGLSLALLIERERPETINETSIRQTPAQAPATSAAEAFPAERRAKAAAPRMSAPKAAMESNVAGDAATSGLGAAAPAAPAAAGRLAPLRPQAAQRSPEAWLEEIGRLKHAGRDKEAAEQLAEFRKAYPAHAVPKSLWSK